MSITPIEIEDDGPIVQFVIPILPEGGVMELTGYHGSGKTTALDAIECLINKQGGLNTRDGAPRAAISGFNMTVRRSNRMHRSGELEVVSLQGRFGVSDLVDPGFEDPEAAERARIKALLQLTDVGADPALFYNLVGGAEAFNMLVGSDVLAAPDLVTMAAGVKAACEKAARALETKRDGSRRKAEATKAAVGEIDLNAPHDEKTLGEALEKAIRDHSALETASKAAISAQTASKKAKEDLEKIATEYKGRSVVDAQSDLESANIIHHQAKSLVEDLEARLRDAKASLTLAETKKTTAETALTTAQEHERAVAGFKAILEAEQPKPVGLDDLEAAENAVKQARAADQQGAIVRKAIEENEKAEGFKTEALKYDREARTLREAGQATDVVLSNAVKKLGDGCPLSVVGGRLVLPTDRSPNEPFADLSRGEATYVAVGIAIKAVGQGGVFTIPQHFWEGLAHSVQRRVAAMAEEAGVTIYTARVTDDPELKAEQFEAFPLAEASQ